MVTAPISKPVSCGCAAGAVCPAAIVIVAGKMVALAGLLLLSEIVTFDAAGAASDMGNATDLPSPTLTFEGMVMEPGALTFAVAVAFGMFGVVVLAVIVAEPGPTAVTGTLTLF
jgi:hypothetical protein